MQCDISKDEGVEIQSAAWSFTPDASSSRKKTLPGSEESWGGAAVEPGSMEVEVTYTEGGGSTEHEETLSANVVVSARSWSWPAGQGGVDGSRIPDGCYGNAMGLTVGRMDAGSCSGYFFDYLNGFTPGAGSGPWAGTGFVASKNNSSSVAGAYWGYNPQIRSNGPAYDPATLPSAIRNVGACRSSANVHTVNGCSSGVRGDDDRSEVFDDLFEEVEEHETNHVNAVTAEAGDHDVWGAWEAVVAASESAARTIAQTAASEVQTALLDATLAVDASYSSRTFRIWWWTGSQWEKVRVETGH
ncbi:hypothetical protein [Candidatus Palauibacter sp.]|uniref:hypothetical protein n=1 Tax=Candidatus Palauibacter sp. TaxID=3101350 RepID=UPI003C6FC075